MEMADEAGGGFEPGPNGEGAENGCSHGVDEGALDSPYGCRAVSGG